MKRKPSVLYLSPGFVTFRRGTWMDGWKDVDGYLDGVGREHGNEFCAESGAFCNMCKSKCNLSAFHSGGLKPQM